MNLYRRLSVATSALALLLAASSALAAEPGKPKLAEHGGFAHDDTNVVLLLSYPTFLPRTVSTVVGTAQLAPTILKALGRNPSALEAVQVEGTPVLPAVPFN
jgi:arylsulfatase A-like enzyme